MKLRLILTARQWSAHMVLLYRVAQQLYKHADGVMIRMELLAPGVTLEQIKNTMEAGGLHPEIVDLDEPYPLDLAELIKNGVVNP